MAAAPQEVLVIDDSALARALIVHYLTDEGYALREAADGEQALVSVEERRPDVILMDVEMPGMDGHGVLRRLRAHPTHHDIPVVFVTGRGAPTDVADGLGLGAHDYLRKPFEPVELVARVRSAARVGALQDALRERNLELERLAATDSLTGLANRRFLHDQAERTASRLRRHGGWMGVVLLDIDAFKAINDAHGHTTGDEVLVEVSRRLAVGLRREDVLGRWGGEEFLVLATDTEPEGVAGLAERLRRQVAEGPLDTSSGSLTVTTSAGWAAAMDGAELAELVRHSDGGLYAAKAAGRNLVRGSPLP